MNIGLIGAGAIAEYALEQLSKEASLHVKKILVRDEVKYAHLVKQYGVELVTDIEDLLTDDIDMVAEAANIEAVKMYLPKVLEKKDAVVISIGAFSEQSFLQAITDCAAKSHHTLYLPSGAIGGLDLIQNAKSAGQLTKVKIATRKPASTLTDEPVQGELIVFSGPAKEAIKKYPKNVNVAIVLSLAGIGVSATEVELIADEKTDKNSHVIEVEGDFGQMRLEIANNPLPSNPNSSYLAAASLVSTLIRASKNIRIA